MSRRGLLYDISYRKPGKNELYRKFIQSWWVTQKLRKSRIAVEHLESRGMFWRGYYKLGMIYLDNLSKLKYSFELLSFTLAVWLVNTGSLFMGVLFGVVGILFVNRTTEIPAEIAGTLLEIRE